MRLICGDCLEVMPEIPDGSVDMVLCDLPYGITRNRWDSQLPLARLWEEWHRIAKPEAAIVLFSSGMFTASLMSSNPKEWRYNLVWQKTNAVGFLNARRQPLRAHEDICVFYRRQPVYNPIKVPGPRKVSTASHRRNSKQSSNYNAVEPNSYDSTERFPTSVLTFAKDKQKSAIHPTQKPVALLEWLVRTYTNPGETVLDNCMGSGSTGVACARCGRDFIGIEIEPDYYKAAKERVEGCAGGYETYAQKEEKY